MTKRGGDRSRWNSTFYDRRWYVFAIVSLASLLISLAIFHPRGDDSVIECVIGYDTTRDPDAKYADAESFTARMNSQIRADDAITGALQRMDRDALATLGSSVAGNEELLQRLYVKTRKFGSGHEIRVRFLAADDDAGISFVDELVSRVPAPRRSHVQPTQSVHE